MMRKLAAGLLLTSAFLATLAAQAKPPITRADYGQWETLVAAQGEGAFSPDGAWLAYSVSRANRNNELRFQRLSDNITKVAPFGSGAVYSLDGRWAGFLSTVSEDEQERMRQGRTPIQTKFGLLDLSSGEISTTDGIQTFRFSGDGKYLVMRRYAPVAAGAAAPPEAGGRGGGRGGGPGTGADTPALGVTVIVRDLASGRDTTFGNVVEQVWQDDERGHLLAMAIGAEGQSGNGIHIFNPATTVLRVLDSSAAAYGSLAWRKDSTDLAALRSKVDERREGPAQSVIAWRDLGGAAEKRFELDATSASIGAGMRVVDYRRPAWSDDGRTVFLGIAAWADKPPAPARGAGAGRGGDGEASAGRGAAAGGAARGAERGGGSGGVGGETGERGREAAPERDEPAGVDVWHWKDTLVIPRQKLTAAADRRRNLLSAWHIENSAFVHLAKTDLEVVTPLAGTARIYIEDGAPYAMARSIGRPAADLSVADLLTGRRTPLKTNVNDATAQPSAAGRYVIYADGGHYWTIDLASGSTTNITRQVKTSFVDSESDATGPAKPMFGVAGWTRDDQTVLLYDKHDVWQVTPDGRTARRLTDGAGDGVRHRLTRLDTRDPWIEGQTYVAVFGLRSKKSGYKRLAIPASVSGAAPAVEVLLWKDESIGNLAKARRSDVYAYVAQRHDDAPDIFVGDSRLAAARQATSTNAFQSRYAWSRGEIVEYKSATGEALQGSLYYPAGYEPGRTYPMIVYLYERLSDSVHRYVAPSDRDYYNTTVFTSQGYFVLQPDIVFRPGEPGLSVVECVTPAVKRVVDLGLADAKRVGVIGHSWGGFDTAFLATNTTGVFAGAVAGAAITNLVSNFGNHHWSSGIAETDHIETGQQRMVVPLYDDLQAYIRNSAVYNVHKMTTPLMLMTGDNDGTVHWHQAVEMYNIARRARKNVVMLAYAGEDHSLRQAKNQIDYQQRILAWFGHYLKGEPATPWIVNGQSVIDRELEVRRAGGGR